MVGTVNKSIVAFAPVFTRSPALVGTSVGATTVHCTPSSASCQNRTQAPYLAIRFRNGYGDRLRMDIQNPKS